MDVSIINLVSDEESEAVVKTMKTNPHETTKKHYNHKGICPDDSYDTEKKPFIKSEGKQIIKNEPVVSDIKPMIKTDPVHTSDVKPIIKSKPKLEPQKRKKKQLLSPKSKKIKTECEESPVKKRTRTIGKTERSKEKTDIKNLKFVEEECTSTGVSGEKSTAKTSILQDKIKFHVEWQIENVIAEKLKLSVPIVRNVIQLFEAENTIPFIARYRKEKTGHMEPEMLRCVKDNHDRLMSVKQKMDSVAASITKMNKMTPSIFAALRSSQSFNEIEHIYAQFKPSGARTLAERARVLGLEDAAMAILEGTTFVNPDTLVNSKTESLSKVLQGLQHIIADVISKHKVILDTMRKMCEKFKTNICIETKKTNEKSSKTKKETKKNKTSNVDEFTTSKFQLYFTFRSSVYHIKPHQVLAICRAETLKIISVKVTFPDHFLHTIHNVCNQEWLSKGMYFPIRTELVKKSIDDAYIRLLQPHAVREIRSDLMEEAHRASIEVFAKNLKHLLLTPPVRGEVVIGIDPGYTHGCKLAVVNSNGDVLKTDVLYIHKGVKRGEDEQKLRSFVLEYRCEIIALGNGTACRETEMWISSLIKNGCFSPLNVKYTIVDEQGVSIYSCSPVAKQEFPHLDPNVISAISLSRRIQDPLSEFVKVEPKHLGVGMYQHDIPEKKLSSTLNEVVMECVSFVGVDVNTASETLLRHVAGLNSTRAANIIDWRTKNGPFLNRDQLHRVKGMGPKSFEQCAGFLRILSKTSSFMCFGDLKDCETEPKSKSNKKSTVVSENSPNPLDQTWIHPESYATVYWLVGLCDVSLADFGKEMFLNKINRKIEEIGFKNIASKADISEERLKLIIDGLKEKPDDDYRSKFQKPLFRSSIRSVDDLKVGSVLTGRVNNVTHFGAFVDIGVGNDGLIHVSQMRNATVNVGDSVEVIVKDLTLGQRKPKIGLSLSKVL